MSSLKVPNNTPETSTSHVPVMTQKEFLRRKMRLNYDENRQGDILCLNRGIVALMDALLDGMDEEKLTEKGHRADVAKVEELLDTVHTLLREPVQRLLKE